MNAKTAKKLNSLLAAARPIILASNGSSYVIKGENGGTYSREDLNASVNLMEDLNDALMESVPSVTANRIRAAAKKREVVDLPYVKELTYPLGWIVPADVVAEAALVINAILDTHNAKTLNNYEVYRIACEQGVAVPPKD